MRKHKFAIALVSLSVALGVTAVGPTVATSVGPVTVGVESAHAAPGGEGGGGNADVKNIGDNTADLLEGWLTPLLVVLTGGIVLFGIIKREAGVIVAGLVGFVIAGFFLVTPDSAQDVVEGISKAVT